MTKKPFRSRSWLELTSRCERAIAWSRSASAAFARPLVASRIAPTRLNHARARLGAIVFLSALGFALFGIVMRAALLAAPADTAPTGGKVLIAGGQGTHGGNFYISSTELYDPATNSFAAAADTAAMNHARSDATATLLPSGKVLSPGRVSRPEAWALQSGHDGARGSCLQEPEPPVPALPGPRSLQGLAGGYPGSHPPSGEEVNEKGRSRGRCDRGPGTVSDPETAAVRASRRALGIPRGKNQAGRKPRSGIEAGGPGRVGGPGWSRPAPHDRQACLHAL